jgi:hypothetical protein
MKWVRKPPLNHLCGKINHILFDNTIFWNYQKAKELQKLFTFSNIFFHRIYKIKYWLWRKFNETE